MAQMDVPYNLCICWKNNNNLVFLHINKTSLNRLLNYFVRAQCRA
jgi:hypothetical protein